MKAALITEEQIKTIEDALMELIYSSSTETAMSKSSQAILTLASLKVQEPVAEVDRNLLSNIGWHCLCIPKDETLLYAGEQP